jgi:predicted acyltransferase
MSKPLWTPPFVIQTVGITLLSWILASLIDFYPNIPVPGIPLLEAMGRKSLEVYLAAEILQEFVMYPGKRHGGGLWESMVQKVCWIGVERTWSCLLVSLGWGMAFAGFGWIVDLMNWKIRL